MKTKTNSPKFLQKRKFFLVLPLLVLPFITLMFWALGGGKFNDAQAQQQTAKGGLNLELPDAYLRDDKTLDKLSYYEKAASDSAKLEELMKNDPYYLQNRHEKMDEQSLSNDTLLPTVQQKQDFSIRRNGLNTSPYNNHNYSDANEEKVYKKLNELNTALNQAPVQTDKEVNRSIGLPE